MSPIGSTVVYSTCTFAPEENEDVVNSIINEENMELKKISLDGMKMGKDEDEEEDKKDEDSSEKQN